MEGEVRVLDSRAPPGWQGDCQGQVGSRHRDLSIEAMGSNAATGSGTETCPAIAASAPLFFYDSQPNGWTPIETYIRARESILGDTDDIDAPSIMEGTNTRRCFNCGSPDHKADACPLPHDRQRISLSRQLFLFLKPQEFASHERIHVASEWNRQRLEWVDMFTPGIIKGELLQTALGDEEYLKRIALWGYPKGWYSVQDPRELMKERILTNGENDCQDSTPIMIFGDEDESDSEPGSASKDSATTLDFSSRSHSPELEILPKRWARYPCSYFDSDTLFLYTPRSQIVPFEDSCPPSLLNDQVSTFTPERQRLWERIISGEVAESGHAMSHAPWRLSNAFSHFAVPDGSTLLPCAPLPAEPPPPIPSPPLSAGSVEPEIHNKDEENNGVLIRPARPLLKSVSPYGLLFSNPAVDLNAINNASGSAICSIHSPVSIASDMDISDAE